MHGRPREDPNSVSAAERANRERQIARYCKLTDKVLKLRRAKNYTDDSMKLCTTVLEINPEFYTMWNYRKEILLSFFESRPDEKAELCEKELQLVVRSLQRNPKSYNAWYHRVWIVKHDTADLVAELDLCTKYLKLDSRNFHCWDYRRFIVKKAAVSLEKELAFTTSKIHENFSNYSSWHYRSKLLPKIFEGDELKQKLDDDFELVLNAFFTEPMDQSAWLYHRWLLAQAASLVIKPIELTDGQNGARLVESSSTTEKESAKPVNIKILKRELAACEELVEEEPKCKWAILTLALLKSAIARAQLQSPSDSSSADISSLVEANAEVAAFFEKLNKLDPMRSKYYSDFQKCLSS